MKVLILSINYWPELLASVPLRPTAQSTLPSGAREGGLHDVSGLSRMEDSRALYRKNCAERDTEMS